MMKVAQYTPKEARKKEDDWLKYMPGAGQRAKSMRPENVAKNQAELELEWERNARVVLFVLEEHGPMRAVDIEKHLPSLTNRQIRYCLSKLRQRNKAASVGRGVWWSLQ